MASGIYRAYKELVFAGLNVAGTEFTLRLMNNAFRTVANAAHFYTVSVLTDVAAYEVSAADITGYAAMPLIAGDISMITLAGTNRVTHDLANQIWLNIQYSGSGDAYLGGLLIHQTASPYTLAHFAQFTSAVQITTALSDLTVAIPTNGLFGW